jgi:MerR family copper efflux transcriptional regulator
MNIGTLARETGISAKTIRYYESIGLTPEPDRQPNGYRDYGDSDVATLKFVQRARGLGFSLEEVRALLTLWRDHGRASADVKKLALDHIQEIEGRIGELQAMKRTLEHLTERCHGDDRPDCPILEDLAKPG